MFPKKNFLDLNGILIASVILIALSRYEHGISLFGLIYVSIASICAILVRWAIGVTDFCSVSRWFGGMKLRIAFLLIANAANLIYILSSYFLGFISILDAIGAMLFSSLVFNTFAVIGIRISKSSESR
jgi:hypothetical protein